MNKKNNAPRGKNKSSNYTRRAVSRPGSRPSSSSKPGSRPPRPRQRPQPMEGGKSKGPLGFDIMERPGAEAPASGETEAPAPAAPGPFRVLIAVHRPRYRGRAERAAQFTGWNVTALLNRQDPVGMVAKPPTPPDLLILSGDFGRQRDYGIFRAVQTWRSKGMKLIGLVDDCDTAPEDYPDSVPSQLCDICLPPPYKTADLRALFARFYEEMRGKPAPPPRSREPETDEDSDEG